MGRNNQHLGESPYKYMEDTINGSTDIDDDLYLYFEGNWYVRTTPSGIEFNDKELDRRLWVEYADHFWAWLGTEIEKTQERLNNLEKIWKQRKKTD